MVSFMFMVQGRIEKQNDFRDRKGSPYRQRHFSTIVEEDEVSLSPVPSTDGGRVSDVRVTFQLGDASLDLTSEPSNPSIRMARPRSGELSRDVGSNDVEACDSGVAGEMNSGQPQSHDILGGKANCEFQRQMSRLESRLAKLEVHIDRVVELLERGSVSRLSLSETSL